MSEVKINIHSIHFDADDKLIEFIQTKINKLSNLSDKIIESEVFLKLDNGNAIDNKVVEIKLGIPGNDLFAKKIGKSFEEASDSAVEALRKQLQKRKEKVWGV
jgi:putative sigma-54 modulation protein